MERTSLSQIHEKIAILNNYLSEIPWPNKDIADYKSKKMVSDVRAVSEIKNILTIQQEEELRKVRDKLIEQMVSKDYDVSEIKVVFEELFTWISYPCLRLPSLIFQHYMPLHLSSRIRYRNKLAE